MFPLEEQILLLKSNLWHLSREEHRIRRKMKSIFSKLEQSKRQLRDFISLAKDEQRGINSNLERLNNAESHIRAQLDDMCTPSEDMTAEDVSMDYSHIRRRQKQISKALLDVVNERNSLEQKLVLAHAASRIIQTLLEEDWNETTVEMIKQEIKENPEIEKTAKKYMEIREQLENTRGKLIALLKRREYTKQALAWARRSLHHDREDDGSDSSESFETLARDFDLEVKFSDEKLKNILVKLCENIRSSGLIRQRRRAGRSYPLVFVGSELVTWAVKSDIDDRSNIASDRVEGRILGAMLVHAGLVYSVDESHPEFEDTFLFYRFRCDDAAIRQMTKTGWLTKHGRFRSKRRFYVWDSERQQLFEYKTKDDTVPAYRYPFEHGAEIRPSRSNESVFDIILTHSQRTILRLKAGNPRERDSWIRVLNARDPTDSQTAQDGDSSGDPHYEEFRYLRAKNRLKWSTLYMNLQTSEHEVVDNFRKFIAQQAKLDTCDKRMLQSKLTFMFEDPDNPIGNLFQSFADIFLEPFRQISVEDLHRNSVDNILTLCSNDLQSFLSHTHSLTLQLLIPESVEIVSPDSRPRNPTLKALNRYLRQTICSHIFSHGVYSAIFPLYQRAHIEVDRQLQELVSRYHCLRARDFKVSTEFCVDDDDPLPDHCDCRTHESENKESEDVFLGAITTFPGTPPNDLQSLMSVGGSESAVSGMTSPQSSSLPPNFEQVVSHTAPSRTQMIEDILRESSRENEIRSREKRRMVEMRDHDDGDSSAMEKLWGSSSRLTGSKLSYPAYDRNSPRTNKSNIQSLSDNLTMSERKWAFEPCLEKLLELGQRRSPRDKLRCLTQLKDLICRCVDDRLNMYDSSESDDDMVERQMSDADSSIVVGRAPSSSAAPSSATSVFTATTMNTTSTASEQMSIASSLENLGNLTRHSSTDCVKFPIESVPENSSMYEAATPKTPKGRTHGIVGDDNDHSIASVISVMSVESEMSDVWGMNASSLHQRQSQEFLNISNSCSLEEKVSALDKSPVTTPRIKKRKKKKKRKKEMLIDGSDILALFALVICRTRLGSINAEIAFMEDFMNDEEAQMKSGYYLTVLRAATAALIDGTFP